ncbi:MAG: flagellar biosynthetic protein FliO [Deltaproteobacteria bacterium]|nr:flagellar biosynthetic protein FliO [Deltaproteobacteria bacterium]
MSKWSESLQKRTTWRRFSMLLGALLLVASCMTKPVAATDGANVSTMSWGILLAAGGVGALWWMRRRKSGSKTTSCLVSRETLKLGNNRSVHLLEVEGRRLLVGCAGERMQVLARWTDSESRGCEEGERS